MLCVALVGVLCSVQAKGEGDAYFSIAEKAYQSKGYKKALEYFKKAASMGDAAGYNNLGNLYENGEGVQKNLQRALEYHKKACELGFKDACHRIK